MKYNFTHNLGLVTHLAIATGQAGASQGHTQGIHVGMEIITEALLAKDCIVLGKIFLCCLASS